MAGFSILTVCSGNICRSPIAEQVLRAGLVGIPDVVLGSAGTIARDGDVMPEQAQALSRRLGGNPDGHRARYLITAPIEAAQLVLAMSREHRRAAVTLLPRASRYTFTIREFARLSTGIDEAELRGFGITLDQPVRERLVGLVALVASRRGLVDPALDPAEDDVVDPYRRDDATYALSGQQLAPAVAEAVRVLRLAAGAPA